MVMFVLVPMLMMLVPMAVFAGFFVVMMVFVYHGFVYFPRAKVRHPGCNRVANVAGIG